VALHKQLWLAVSGLAYPSAVAPLSMPLRASLLEQIRDRVASSTPTLPAARRCCRRCARLVLIALPLLLQALRGAQVTPSALVG
jgi:hypothetical protein